MPLWKSPFNKVVRSHEAGIIGILIGIMIGVAAMIFVPVVVDTDQFIDIPDYCGGYDKIDNVRFSYTGRVTKVKCLNGIILDDF